VKNQITIEGKVTTVYGETIYLTVTGVNDPTGAAIMWKQAAEKISERRRG